MTQQVSPCGKQRWLSRSQQHCLHWKKSKKYTVSSNADKTQHSAGCKHGGDTEPYWVIDTLCGSAALIKRPTEAQNFRDLWAAAVCQNEDSLLLSQIYTECETNEHDFRCISGFIKFFEMIIEDILKLFKKGRQTSLQ